MTVAELRTYRQDLKNELRHTTREADRAELEAAIAECTSRLDEKAAEARTMRGPLLDQISALDNQINGARSPEARNAALQQKAAVKRALATVDAM